MGLYDEVREKIHEENQGYIRGLLCAKSIIMHSKDKAKALQSLLNAIDIALLPQFDEVKE